MVNNEKKLLLEALQYEEGHKRRTQHILKVYSLVSLFCEYEDISEEEKIILRAAAILHDIAIKYAKQHCNGDASQENQKKFAPMLVEKFLLNANYNKSYISKVIQLVLNHHNYYEEHCKSLQILIEADLIINFYESDYNQDRIQQIKTIFKTKIGKELLETYEKNNKI